LSRKSEERATTINASDARVASKEPIQSRVRARGNKLSRSARQGKVVEELLKRVGNKEGVGETSMTERGGDERRGLENNRSNGKEMRVGGKSKRNRAELGGEREPCTSTIRKEEMAAGAGRGRRFEGRIIDREARQRTKTKRKTSEEGMSRIGSGGRGRRRRSDENRSNMGDTFQRVVPADDSRVIGGGASSTVGEEKLKGKGEVLGDESIVMMASKAIDISHHSSWAMEDLKEATKEHLGPAADLMNGAIMLQSQKNSEPQRNFRFWLITQRPQPASPTKE
jgi:hypothetical protein